MGAVCHFVSTSTLPVLGGYFPGPVGSEHLSWDEQGVYFLLPRLSLNAGLDKADLSQNSDGWRHLKVNLPFLWDTYTGARGSKAPVLSARLTFVSPAVHSGSASTTADLGVAGGQGAYGRGVWQESTWAWGRKEKFKIKNDQAIGGWRGRRLRRKTSWEFHLDRR